MQEQLPRSINGASAGRTCATLEFIRQIKAAEMWVFGYGSLMWDKWHDDLECQSKKIGILRDYRRIFNKASTKNWGTKDNPGPTLNLIKENKSSCKGVLFQFADGKKDLVLNRLKEREHRSGVRS
ncbi:MAG: gamma-glutamylcyclotransferase [Gammaproteobacteria bacterium]|nr:gamma-glutamylcyclotransferase [Gammaproteobacteria bacterium]